MFQETWRWSILICHCNFLLPCSERKVATEVQGQ